MVGAHPGARNHQVGARDQRRPIVAGGPLDDRCPQRLDRAHARVVPAVPRILFDNGHGVAVTSACPGDGLTRGAQSDDEDAPGHSMMPWMLMKS